MSFEDFGLNGINQSQQDKYYMIVRGEVPRVVRFIETESRMVLTGLE